jgi:predicted transcriptional regulator
LESEKALTDDSQQQANDKKKGKIAKSTRCMRKGFRQKRVASKMNLSERLVRAYIWRMKNPEKYKALLSEYLAKRRQKQENQEIKNVLKKQA